MTLDRLLRHAAILALIAVAASVASDRNPAQAAGCFIAHVTGYVETGHATADGTPTPGLAWTIAAAHPRIPFGTLLEIEEVGVVRVADRGLLGWNDVDILVESVAQAYRLTGSYRVCER